MTAPERLDNMWVIHLSLNNPGNRRRSSLLAVQSDSYHLEPVLVLRFKTGKGITGIGGDLVDPYIVARERIRCILVDVRFGACHFFNLGNRFTGAVNGYLQFFNG